MTQSLAPEPNRPPTQHPRLHGFVDAGAPIAGTYLEPEASERWFVSPSVASKRRPLSTLVDGFLEPRGAARLLLVMGAAGVGKTSFVLNHVAARERRIVEASRDMLGRIRLFFGLATPTAPAEPPLSLRR